MKSRGSALLAALLFAASCSTAKTYEMRGQILGVNRDKMEILVKHDEIPGLMAAMTMPWKVKTANMLDNIGPGDLITIARLSSRTIKGSSRRSPSSARRSPTCRHPPVRHSRA